MTIKVCGTSTKFGLKNLEENFRDTWKSLSMRNEDRGKTASIVNDQSAMITVQLEVDVGVGKAQSVLTFF
jgi:hypothetical protein